MHRVLWPLEGEVRSIYAVLCRVTLACLAEPLVLIDWSDLKADQSLHLLRASLPVGGRSLTLYEEVHPQKQFGNRVVQPRLLQHLAQLMPSQVKPMIIADAGFRVPFYQGVERLGWRWVGRVRGRDYVRLDHGWVSCQTLFKRATTTPTALGEGEWVRRNPLRARLVLVRLVNKGRRRNNAFGKRARSKASARNARSAKEPWLVVADTRLADVPAKQLVRWYRQRMQIEESFRDLKSQQFGEGLECSRSRGVGRFTVLVLIASLAAFVLWLLGTAAQRGGLERWLHPGNGKRRVYSRLFLARLLLVLENCREVLRELVGRIGPPDQWVAEDHNALLAD
ncbi:IS4 family transposase [Candidatus Thiosymbion oneisti]|uniref:IS4 family transposase n=1 Tax=Candidatus Thiosymbion oneisti TaxID=589554 RepID=UPI0013FDCC46|nr:IS4 family transposase [Candidatus Thiosymbion oneisti]